MGLENLRIEKDEFCRLMPGFIGAVVGKDTAKGAEVDQLSRSISPIIFSMFDSDRNGVLDGEEANMMRAFLSYCDPDTLRAALLRRSSGPVAQRAQETM